MNWSPVDTATPVNATTARLIEAAPILTALARQAPALAGSMRDVMQGQPRAAAYDQERSTPANWCWTHEQSTSQCWDQGWTCEGEPVHRHTDPTGEAACTSDRAAQHHTQFMRIADRITRDILALADIAALYPTTSTMPAQVLEDGPGDQWCSSCWRDNRHCEPVTRRTTTDGTVGAPLVRGLCRWCADFRRAEKMLPPVPLLELRHRGVRITEGQVRKAVMDARRPGKTKRAKRHTL